ncbi:MAG: PEP-CTERM sorting domain-containing protein [Aureliella sp.]
MHRTLLLVLFLVSGQNLAHGALVVGGTTTFEFTPIQDITLFAGGPLMLGSQVDFVDANGTGVVADGLGQFERVQQTQAGTIELINGVFTGTGTLPGFGNFELLAGNNGFDPVTATLTNVVQDPNHPGFDAGSPLSIISADITMTVPNYGARLVDQGGIILEVRDSFFFEGSIDGLPLRSPTRFDSNPFDGAASELDIFLRGDNTNTPLGFSTRRYINAVPEPSAGLASLLVLGLAFCRRRRIE